MTLPDKLYRQVRLEGSERILALTPTDTAFLDALAEAGHSGPIMLMDFDAGRLAETERSAPELDIAFLAIDLLRVEAPPRQAQPLAAYVDVDAAPGKEAAVFLLRSAAGWTNGNLYARGSRALGFESILREAVLGGALVQQDISWRKGMGLATLRALHSGLASPPAGTILRREICSVALALESNPFVFAAGDVDPASALLADAVELEGDESVLDLGCGAGVIGLALCEYLPHGFVVMSDSNLCATALARRNRARNGATNSIIITGIGAAGVRAAGFDVVVLNPPFHQGRRDDRDLGAYLVCQALHACRPGGSVYVVANRFLPYDRLMREHGPTEETAGTSAFRVLRTRKSG